MVTLGKKGGEKMKFTKLFTPLVLLIFVGGMVAPIPAMAQETTPTGGNGNWFTGVAQFLAQTFHLDQNQVKNALNTYISQKRQTMQQHMQNREKSRLDNLVSQGKITSSQEQAILTELATLHSTYNPANFKNMTPQQKRAQMQQERNDLMTWAKNNNIDPTFILPRSGMGMHRGWSNPTTTPTPTP